MDRSGLQLPRLSQARRLNLLARNVRIPTLASPFLHGSAVTGSNCLFLVACRFPHQQSDTLQLRLEVDKYV